MVIVVQYFVTGVAYAEEPDRSGLAWYIAWPLLPLVPVIEWLDEEINKCKEPPAAATTNRGKRRRQWLWNSNASQCEKGSRDRCFADHLLYTTVAYIHPLLHKADTRPDSRVVAPF